jgi:hypothetical protein
MIHLISVDEIQLYKDLGKNPDLKKIKPVIEQAQDVDLRDMIGAHFYFDIVSNVENEDYQDLLSGSTFECNGVTYHQEGLKALLADLFMSRYLDVIQVNITAFGATVKHSEDSQPTDKGSLRDASKAQRQMAGNKLEIIKLYLKANANKFPAYNYKADTVASGERRLRFRKI